MTTENYYNPIQIIKNSSFSTQNGIDRFPGEMVELDSDQIFINGKECRASIYAWFDKKIVSKGRLCNNYIITYEGNIIITDYFFEAAETYKYIIETYKEK